MGPDERLPRMLLLLRLSLFVLLLMWTIDKFVHPEHAARAYENFYFISGLSTAAFSPEEWARSCPQHAPQRIALVHS